MTLPTRLELSMPDWFDDLEPTLPEVVADLEERMRVVIDLSRRNFEAGTGGPFSAGVFERESGRVVALGVNRVVPSNCSCAHAEFMAISLAQRALGRWDLGGDDGPAHQFVVNWRPCTMCFGSVLWSGVVDLVIAGDGPELEELTGFDEGPIHPDWRGQLAARGIALTEGVLRDDAVAVFRAFGESDALVYNGRGGGRH
ncbi:MAG: nucleoside deaminase [Actinomycetota bacterium]|nr:nucleoside deaminase [Actinomycetota bacterium]